MIIKDVLPVRLGIVLYWGSFEHPGPIKIDQFLLNPDFKILIMLGVFKMERKYGFIESL